MKLLSFEIQNRKSFGAVIDDGVIDLGRKFEGRYADLLAVLEADALPELEAACVGAKPDYALTDITFLPVIPNPPKIICIGVNYEAHRSEIGRDPSKKPMVFARFPASQIGHMQPLLRPSPIHLTMKGRSQSSSANPAAGSRKPIPGAILPAMRLIMTAVFANGRGTQGNGRRARTGIKRVVLAPGCQRAAKFLTTRRCISRPASTDKKSKVRTPAR